MFSLGIPVVSPGNFLVFSLGKSDFPCEFLRFPLEKPVFLRNSSASGRNVHGFPHSPGPRKTGNSSENREPSLTDPAGEVDADFLGAEGSLGINPAAFPVLIPAPVQEHLDPGAGRESAAFGLGPHPALAQRHGGGFPRGKKQGFGSKNRDLDRKRHSQSLESLKGKGEAAPGWVGKGSGSSQIFLPPLLSSKIPVKPVRPSKI